MTSRRSRTSSQRLHAHVVSASSIRLAAEALRTKNPADLLVEDLREIGRQIELALRDEAPALASSNSASAAGLRAAGLEAAALFNTTCSTRSAKEQEALLGTQDKVLAGLRSVSSSLPPSPVSAMHRQLRAALLPLVAQPGFVKKRKGYRQHLVQALAEAAPGPLPPSALLPILLARETGPAAADLALEVLERVTSEEHNPGGGGGGSSGSSNDASKKAVIGFLHQVVAEVLTSGTTGRGKRGTNKAPPAHLMSFLVQACATLPDFVLVFAKDLLGLAESRSSSARKLSLAVMEAVLDHEHEHGHGHGRGRGAPRPCGENIPTPTSTPSPNPALGAVLWLARSDGDATVRCSAFDTVARYVGQMGASYFDHRGDDYNTCDDLDDDGSSPSKGNLAASPRSEILLEEDGAARISSSGNGSGNPSGTGEGGGSANRTRTMGTTSYDSDTPGHRTGVDPASSPSGGQAPLGPPTPPREGAKTGRTSRGQGSDGGGERGNGNALETATKTTTTTASASTSTSASASASKLSARQGMGDARAARSRDQRRREAVPGGPWGVGGVLLLSLSASAEALSADGSKAVRAKALACSLRILETHGGGGPGTAGRSCGDGAMSHGGEEGPIFPSCARKIISKIARGAWGALQAVASDRGGGVAPASATGGGGRHRKTADTARDLLTLPCVDAKPADLVVCYERCCKAAPVAGGDGALGAVEAKRALRDIAQASFCRNLGALLTAVSDVMAADERSGGGGGSEGGDHRDPRGERESFADTSEGASSSLSDVLCEVLAGVDGEVVASLLKSALEAYADDVAVRDEGDGGQGRGRPSADTSATSSAVLLRTLALLAAADEDQLRVLALSQRLFWGRLERRMEEIERNEDAADQDQEGEDEGGQMEAGTRREGGVGSEDEGTGGRAGAAAAALADARRQKKKEHPKKKNDPEEELSELLRIFQLLASHSLASAGSSHAGNAGSSGSVALETLVFPTALSRRRLIPPAVGLALALDEPHRVLLSSLAVLQDAAFARSSTDIGRACDYVRLIGVLARENASLVAAHVRERYGNGGGGVARGRRGQNRSREEGRGGAGGEEPEDEADDYMAEDADREAMEWEILRLREASVTSDGMLSCYTPFLLAIVQRRIADSAAALRGLESSPPPPSPPPPTTSSCPRALCAEAMWALSEYAVLSPGLAAEVLPLAECLASDAQEHIQIRSAAVGVLTRRELATDEIAAAACLLLEDEDPRLRREVLCRLGRLMKESRIKTVHLSRFALLLVDECEGVRRTARAVFFDHLQPRPDTVARCLFETYFTLDAEESVKRPVLDRLIGVAHEAAPGQGLAPLGAALMRKAAETGDSQAAYFLSLVPPTVNSLEAAEVALRRGQLAQAPADTVSLVAAHFAKRGGSSPSISSSSVATGTGGQTTTPSKAQALEIAARIGSLVRGVGRASSRPRHAVAAGYDAAKTAPARTRRAQQAKQSAAHGGGWGAASPAPAADESPTREGSGGEGSRGEQEDFRQNRASRGSKKRGRAREAPVGRHGHVKGSGGVGNGSRTVGKAKGKEKRASDCVSMEEEEEEEEEEEWEG